MIQAITCLFIFFSSVFPQVQNSKMADVHKLVFSILKFLEDQKTSGQLDDEAVESLEGIIFCLVVLMDVEKISCNFCSPGVCYKAADFHLESLKF